MVKRQCIPFFDSINKFNKIHSEFQSISVCKSNELDLAFFTSTRMMINHFSNNKYNFASVVTFHRQPWIANRISSQPNRLVCHCAKSTQKKADSECVQSNGNPKYWVVTNCHYSQGDLCQVNGPMSNIRIIRFSYSVHVDSFCSINQFNMQLRTNGNESPTLSHTIWPSRADGFFPNCIWVYY